MCGFKICVGNMRGFEICVGQFWKNKKNISSALESLLEISPNLKKSYLRGSFIWILRYIGLPLSLSDLFFLNLELIELDKILVHFIWCLKHHKYDKYVWESKINAVLARTKKGCELGRFRVLILNINDPV